MAGYVELDGVRTWYDERGTGDPVVALHGGLTDSRDFQGNLIRLAERYRLLLPERRGHGHTPDVPGPLTVDVMAADTIAFVEHVVGGPVRLVGYSAGAAVALVVALRRPDLVDRLVLISCAADPAALLIAPSRDGAIPPIIAAAYGEVSPDGIDHLPVVVGKIVDAVEAGTAISEDELAGLACPVLVMAADDDIVALDHTIALYRTFPHAQLAIVPDTSHTLLHEKPELCGRVVEDFLSGATSPTFMPMRRAVPPSR